MVPTAVIFREHFLCPEVKAVDISMPEIHTTLVRFQAGIMLVPGRNRIADGKAPGDDHALRVPYRLQIGFCCLGIKIVGGKRLTANRDLNGISLARKAHRFRLAAGRVKQQPPVPGAPDSVFRSLLFWSSFVPFPSLAH